MTSTPSGISTESMNALCLEELIKLVKNISEQLVVMEKRIDALEKKDA